MKLVVTQYELALLDMMAVTALKLHDLAGYVDHWQQSDEAGAAKTAELVDAVGAAIGLSFRALLLVGRLEIDKRLAIETYIATGAHKPIETFLEGLGVAIADPVV